MSQTSPSVSSPVWLPVSGSDLVPGDAILVTVQRRVATGLRMPEWETEPVGRGHVPGRRVTRYVSVRLAARIIDVQDREATAHRPGGLYVRLEYTGIGNAKKIPEKTNLPIFFHRYDLAALDLDKPGVDLSRHVAHGPSTRTPEAGRAYLRDLLVSAAKARNVDPVEALAATVDPREERMRLPGRRYDGASLFDLGSVHARAVLDGVQPYHEWMLRQIDERLPTPPALAKDDYAPEDIEAHLSSSPNEAFHLDAEEIVAAIPGARVYGIRLAVADGVPVPDAQEEAPRPSGVSPIRKLPPVRYDDDDDDDFVA